MRTYRHWLLIGLTAWHLCSEKSGLKVELISICQRGDFKQSGTLSTLTSSLCKAVYCTVTAPFKSEATYTQLSHTIILGYVTMLVNVGWKNYKTYFKWLQLIEKNFHVFICKSCVHVWVFFQNIWLSSALFYQLLCREHFLTSWFIGTTQHHTNPNSMWANFLFSPQAILFFQPLAPLTELCRRLRGQQIHCIEGAMSCSNLFDLTMALVSNKLTGNRGYLVWLGAICTGIIKWPNPGIYGRTVCLVGIGAL